MTEYVVIDLFGEQFQFNPDKDVDDPELVAKHLERNIKEAQELLKNSTTERNRLAILLLAAMNISKEYHELKAEKATYNKAVESRLLSITKKLNRGLK